MSIRGLWEIHIEAIIDVIFRHYYVETWKPEEMDKILARWRKIKKDNHSKYFHDQQKHVSPFFLSVDGMMGKEAQVVLTTLSRLMAAKMDEPISHVKIWVNVRITIAVASSYSWVLHGAQVPSPLRTR